jgi:hypothetical protein
MVAEIELNIVRGETHLRGSSGWVGSIEVRVEVRISASGLAHDSHGGDVMVSLG